MHFSVISLSDFNNTIKPPAMGRRREGNRWGMNTFLKKEKLIYDIGIYHIQTKPDSPFKAWTSRRWAGSGPSHLTAPPPPPACGRSSAGSQHVSCALRAESVFGWCLWRRKTEENWGSCEFLWIGCLYISKLCCVDMKQVSDTASIRAEGRFSLRSQWKTRRRQGQKRPHSIWNQSSWIQIHKLKLYICAFF